MAKKDLDNIRLIYEGANETTFIIELDDVGNKIHSIAVPDSLRQLSDDYGVYEFQRFHKESDPENYPNIENRKFTVQSYDDNEINYLRDEEGAGTWLDNQGDLKEILHRIVTFGFNFEQLKDHFPRLTEEDYNWLQSLG